MRITDIPADLLKPQAGKKSHVQKAQVTDPTAFVFTGPVPHEPADPNVLLHYNEPLLTWLPVRGHKLLAIACESSESQAHPMLVCELSREQALQFEDRQLKLRDVVYGAKAWYDMPDYFETPPRLVRRLVLPDDLPPMDGYLPAPASTEVHKKSE